MNGYLFLYMLGSMIFGIFGGGEGLYRATTRKQRWGWFLFIVAILNAALACLCGGFRAFPWDWMKA